MCRYLLFVSFLLGIATHSHAQAVYQQNDASYFTFLLGRAVSADERPTTAFGFFFVPARWLDVGLSVASRSGMEGTDTPSKARTETFSFSVTGWPVLQSDDEQISVGVSLSSNTLTILTDPKRTGSMIGLTPVLVREFRSQESPGLSLFVSAAYSLLYPTNDTKLNNRNMLAFESTLAVGSKSRLLLGAGVSNGLDSQLTIYSVTFALVL